MPLTLELPDKPTLNDVRSKLTEAGDYLLGLRKIDDDKRTDSWRSDMRSAVDTIKLLDGVESAMSATLEGPVAALDDVHKGRSGIFDGRGSVGAQVISDEGYKTFAEQKRSGAGYQEIEVRGSLGVQRDIRALIDTADEAAPFVQQASLALPPVVRQRRIFVRDLLSVQTTGLTSIPYIREGHSDEDGGGFTAEGAAKNEVVMDWTEDDAIVRKITAWIPMTTEAIEDAPTLRGYVDTRLGYLVAVAEEEAILAGSGTAPELKGITQFSGLQTQAFVAHPEGATIPDFAVQVAKSCALIETVDGEPDGVAMRPTDYWAFVAQRAAKTFDGNHAGINGTAIEFTPQASSGVPVWGLPVVRSRSVPAGTAIVGAWRMGATLFDRMQTTIKVGNQHSTYFVENKVAIVAEERVALAVHRPDYFVSVDLTST